VKNRWKCLNKSNAGPISRHILISLSITIIATICVLSLVLYINFQSTVLYFIYTSERNNVSHISYSASVMTDMAATFATQIYSDPILYSMLHKVELTGNELTQGSQKLLSVRNSSSSYFFHSIYIINGKANKVFVASPNMYSRQIHEKDSFYDQRALDIIDQYDDYVDHMPVARKVIVPGYSNAEPFHANVFTFVFTDVPRSNKKISSALVFNISDTWMKNTISSMAANLGYRTIITDNRGIVLSSDEDAFYLTDVSEESYMKKILSSVESSGYFVDDVRGCKSLIIYSNHTDLQWSFIRIVPYDLISLRIETAKVKTISIGLLSLVVGLIFSFFTFRRLCRPIDTLFIKMKSLEKDIENNQYTIRQNLLKKVVLNDNIERIPILEEELREQGVQFEIRHSLLPILLRIDNYSSFCNLYGYSERCIRKHMIMTISEGVLSPSFKVVCVEMDEDKIVILLNADSSDSLLPLLRSMSHEITQKLSLSVSIFVSARPLLPPFNLRYLYEDLLFISGYRLYCGHGCVLSTSEVDSFDRSDYSYPKAKENNLIEALRCGKINDMEHAYYDIIQEARGQQVILFNTTLAHLTFAIANTLEELERNGGIMYTFGMTSFIAEMEKMETVEQINVHFLALFNVIIKEMQDLGSLRQQRLVSQINTIIVEQYANPMLSVEALADAMSFTPVYFGRLFRRLFSKPFLTYLTEIRMEKARELLQTSEMSIEEIAIRVGFTSPSYFYKVFKKTHGTTPNSYRSYNRNAPIDDDVDESPHHIN